MYSYVWHVILFYIILLYILSFYSTFLKSHETRRLIKQLYIGFKNVFLFNFKSLKMT
jgi:hypothetical protein